VTLLDGDLVRKHLSSELGFSKEHRDINIRRIGYVASEITKNGGIPICAPIAPYDAVRQQVRTMIEPLGGFILVHVATPVETCEQPTAKRCTPRRVPASSRSSLASQIRMKPKGCVSGNQHEPSDPGRGRPGNHICIWSGKGSLG